MIFVLQATKKLNAFADLDGDDVEIDNDSADDSDDASDFDEDLDPDKIEVPGESRFELSESDWHQYRDAQSNSA